MTNNLKYIFLFSWVLIEFPFLLFAQPFATLNIHNNQISINYQGENIFEGQLSPNADYHIRRQEQELDHKIYQTITITTNRLINFELSGIITAGNESIACESEPKDNGLLLVRHVSGQSLSRRNNAVYNRNRDWLLSFDVLVASVQVMPRPGNQYQVSAKGWEIVIRFKPNYYQQHRGLAYFNPQQYSVYKKPIVGWCSWFAYFSKVTEVDIRKTADMLSAKLKPYGLEYLQIDDGYQQTPIGMPDTWLQANTKFPSGLKALAAYIQSKGMMPGIWTNVSFADSAAAYNNKQLFVLNEKGGPTIGNWVGYVMDASNPETIRQLITPVYKELSAMGWQYFKLDALRHLRYEGYNSHREFFEKKKYSETTAFRNLAQEVRKQIGNEKPLLACWGIRPELVGIADACRIGNDGYSYAGLGQFNSYNNIIWRNDPDHIELSAKEAYRSCVATSLTGSLFMLTDKPEEYESSPLIEAARRCIPVLFTQPGQVYDVDPSRSSLIAGADVEMSGSGPRPFDASTSTTTGLFLLEVNKTFENWMILGRLDARDPIIPFADLGLEAGKEYLVFEFWTKKLRGIFNRQFEPGAIDTAYGCQVFCIREKQTHPQLLATNRHISCGGVELDTLSWNGNQLSGSSQLVPNDDYILYVYEPANFTLSDIVATNAKVLSNEKEGNIRKITFALGKEGQPVKWAILYK